MTVDVTSLDVFVLIGRASLKLFNSVSSKSFLPSLLLPGLAPQLQQGAGLDPGPIRLDPRAPRALLLQPLSADLLFLLALLLLLDSPHLWLVSF